MALFLFIGRGTPFNLFAVRRCEMDDYASMMVFGLGMSYARPLFFGRNGVDDTFTGKPIKYPTILQRECRVSQDVNKKQSHGMEFGQIAAAQCLVSNTAILPCWTVKRFELTGM
jgi:hypothetical protein